MKKRITKATVSMAVGLLLSCVTGQAWAGNLDFAFGMTGYDGNETLTLYTNIGPVVIGTGGQQGWWSDTAANNNNTNGNYIVGRSQPTNDPIMLSNDFFTFDIGASYGRTILPGFTVVTSATLNVTTGEVASQTGKTSESYSLWDVSTDAATLDTVGGPNPGIFDDLQSGVQYGAYTIPANTTYLNMTLNASALADINNAITDASDPRHTFFSIGGSLDLGNNDPPPAPEPASLTLLGIGAAGLTAYVWRRRKANRAA